MNQKVLISDAVEITTAQIQKQFQSSFWKHKYLQYQNRVNCFNSLIRQQTLPINPKNKKQIKKRLVPINQINIEKVKPQKILQYYECIRAIDVNIQTNYQILLKKFYRAKNKLKQEIDECMKNQLNLAVKQKQQQCEKKSQQLFKQKMKRIYTKYYANELITKQK